MYDGLKVAVVIPAFNEERLIAQTIGHVPDFVDYIVPVNDGSQDRTLDVLLDLAENNKAVTVLNNETNLGIGGALMNGFRHALESTDADVIGIVAGDDQCDASYVAPMLDEMQRIGCDYIKASRFYHPDELRTMPAYRQIGNILISLFTKCASGYYSVSDITCGYGFLKRSTLERLRFDLLRPRYDFEVSMLVALSIAKAKVCDFAVPAVYAEETSSIRLLPTVFRNLKAVIAGFWQRIYYKYFLFDFHPIAFLLISGTFLLMIAGGLLVDVLVERTVRTVSPSSGTVGLTILLSILGFQLLLTSFLLDAHNEKSG